MKKLFSLMVIFAILTILVSASDFSDVKETNWYYGYVNTVSQKGIMSGIGNNSFSPDGDFTVAQCLAICARFHADGKDIPETEGAWYDRYVRYCIDENIISENEFDSYTRSITREETARVLSKSLDENVLSPINNIKGIADVPEDDEEYPHYKEKV